MDNPHFTAFLAPIESNLAFACDLDYLGKDQLLQGMADQLEAFALDIMELAMKARSSIPKEDSWTGQASS